MTSNRSHSKLIVCLQRALTLKFKFDDMRRICLLYCKFQVQGALDLYIENIGLIRVVEGPEAFRESDISVNQGYARQKINDHYLCTDEDNLGSGQRGKSPDGDVQRVEVQDPEDDQNQKFSMTTLASKGNGALNSAWRGFLHYAGSPFSTGANEGSRLSQPLWSNGGSAGMRWVRPRR